MREYLRLMRPHQWVKNGFVFTGLLFGHAWREPALVLKVTLAAVAFSFVASGGYIVNDLADREQDRAHPSKRGRPLAAGTVTPRAALAVSAGLVLAGLGIGLAASTGVLLSLLVYLSLSLVYSLGLKNVLILDVFLIASGFMIRILAGTLGVGIPPSRWLLLCGLMLTLFLGFAKRRAELNLTAEGRRESRRTLMHYTGPLLDAAMGITAACVIMSYSLYAMSSETIRAHGTANLIYTVPFIVYGVLRYLFLVESRQRGEDPARELARDPQMLIVGVGWLVVTLLLIR